jgi:hypothetical protein
MRPACWYCQEVMSTKKRYITALIAASALGGCAEPRVDGTAADPSAGARAMRHESAFKPRPALPGEDAVGNWRRVNEEAGRLKGHEGQLGEPAEEE